MAYPVDESREQIEQTLREKARDLNCMCRVDEILSQEDIPDEDLFEQVIRVLPAGFQHPGECRAAIRLNNGKQVPESFNPTEWSLSAEIMMMGQVQGEVIAWYTQEMPRSEEGPFLAAERRMISAVAERLGLHLLQQRLRRGRESWATAVRGIASNDRKMWEVLLEFLSRTDRKLLNRITRKMINHLCWSGVAEGNALLREAGGQIDREESQGEKNGDDNRPSRRKQLKDINLLTRKTFRIAARNLSEQEVVSCIQSWISEEKSTFLIQSLESPCSTVADIAESVERYRGAGIDDSELPHSVQTSLKVALLRRFFVEDLEYINLAKKFVRIGDFYDIVQHLIHPTQSKGKLGGKGAGMFLAEKVIRSSPEHTDLFSDIRVPRTWYVASDAPLDFIHYNNLDEVYNHKYMEVERIREDFPHIVQVFKNSRFPPDISKGLSEALDDFEDNPIIVRSSSLLEDQVGAAFSGKYKSLFLANQGTKKQRLEALQDAIAEVYASVFGPDPIEYRAERGLLDFQEGMGILIQEVVGKKVGKYFFPAFAGVAFSNNEFRWSPRIRREDGLVRLVPGLGTRAVDRLVDDYPVLVSPGQPGLRANVTPDEQVRYSPHKMDVINLEKNSFETVDVIELMRECRDSFPAVKKIISIVEHNHIRKPRGLEPDWERDELAVTFAGLFEDTPFMEQMHALLNTLRDRLGMPVDVEFAHDGEHLYLVQCRSQSHSTEEQPAAIPREIPREKVVFSANRFVSNGHVPDITHIVYVDPEKYADLPSEKLMREVGTAVSRLNKLLPRRQFILMGPGRWGSRGDINLGVSVTYSDINNTAALIEIAREKGKYVPELSFGTHFFQDLVESRIRYLPLYPDEPGVIFNESLLARGRNCLAELVPDLAYLQDVAHVIDVPATCNGQVLKILMNAELDEAVGLLAQPSLPGTDHGEYSWHEENTNNDHWRWRLRMAERLAKNLDGKAYGVKALYIFGSTKNACAGPGSDINLIVHVTRNAETRRKLADWLQGWSLSLAEINYLRTGHKSDGLLDVHYITDEDIAAQTTFACKIGAVTDAARPLELLSRAE